MDLTSTIVTLGTIRPGDSGPAARCFSIKLHSEIQVSGHLGMSGGESPRHAQNPYGASEAKHSMPYHPTLMSSFICQRIALFLSYYTEMTISAEK